LGEYNRSAGTIPARTADTSRFRGTGFGIPISTTDTEKDNNFIIP